MSIYTTAADRIAYEFGIPDSDKPALAKSIEAAERVLSAKSAIEG